MRTVASYLYAAFSVLFLTPAQRRLAKAAEPGAEFAARVHRYAADWARGIVRVTGMKLSVTGGADVPPGRAALYVGNHQSILDIVAMLALAGRPIGFVAKIELLKIPLLSAWMKIIRCIFLDRANLRKSAATMLEGIGILKSGHSLVVFPEGTRSRDGAPLPFKPGSLKLATKSGACVVPFTVNGTRLMLEANRYRVKPGPVHITFHPVILPENLNAEELAALPETVERTVTGGLHA